MKRSHKILITLTMTGVLLVLSFTIHSVYIAGLAYLALIATLKRIPTT